jgi:quercetin dioxygenase-like cupin family protein
MTSKATGSSMLTVSDVTVEPGFKFFYHMHPNTEESIFVVGGEMEFRVGDRRFRAGSGDCVLTPRGIGHGIENVGSAPARLITIFPTAAPEREVIPEPGFTDAEPEKGFFKRSSATAYEFRPGISRFDMVGDFLGSESTYLSELTFQPGAVAPNHYHPAHEESMFCLDGKLNGVYREDNDVPLSAGDMFTCEMGIRHGIFNGSNGVSRLLAIHPVLNPPPRVDVP